jgi:hypothetical protein
MKFFKNLFNRKKKAKIDLLMKEAQEFKCNVNHRDGEITRRFIIPVGNLSKEDAEEQLSKLMSDYKKDVDWDNDVKLPENDINLYFDKDYWFPIKKDKD